MKESIQIIQKKLERYPTANYKFEEDAIEVFPKDENGFAATFYDCGEEKIISFGGWHGHFKEQDEALDWFAMGISNQCRLKVHLRGSFEYKWTVQCLLDGAWQHKDTTSLLFFPFWRSESIQYLQNDLWDGQ